MEDLYMSPSFCAKLKAAVFAAGGGVQIVTVQLDSGEKISVRSNGYWFTPV